MSLKLEPVYTSHLAQLEGEGWAEVEVSVEFWQSIRALEAAADWFFAQPETTKLLSDIRTSAGHRGYVPRAEQGNYSDEGKRRYEAFDVGREPCTTDKVHHPLRGRNQWPDHPTFSMVFCDAFERYEGLAADIGHSLCHYLGVDTTSFESLRREPVSQLRLIRYLAPTVIDLRVTPGTAMGAHTDYEFFTLLHQTRPGLEILDRHGRWVAPEPLTGSVILIAGDMLEVFSGGRFPSTLHRAGASVEAGRTTIPFFCGADFDAKVQSVTGDGESLGLDAGRHMMKQLMRDFPYLTANHPSNDHDLIDLTDPDGFAPLSPFEQRRLATQRGESTKLA